MTAPLTTAVLAWFAERHATGADPLRFPFDSEWVYAPPGGAFLRYGRRPCYATQTLPLTLVLANLELRSSARGKGWLKTDLLPALITQATTWRQPLQIENVINPRLAHFLARAGYAQAGPPGSGVPSFQLVGPFS